uniref:NB-ARC domain-containing protein n=1 Tax=Oryza punctata TaxID=4537 RepID=A0A0E0KN14_ORYPU
MVARTIGGWIASACISKLVDKVCSYAGDQYEYQREDRKDKLRSLKKSLLTVQELVYRAERLQGRETNIANQLRGIKDAACQAEDVLDLLDYRVLEAQAEVLDKVTNKPRVMGKVTINSISSAIAGSSSSCSSSSSSITTLSSDSAVKRSVRVLKRFLFSDEDLTKLAAAVTIFNEIDSRMKTLLELMKLENRAPEHPVQWHPTTSILNTINEGTHQKKLLIQTNEKSSQPYDVISIVGIAGKVDIERLTKEMVRSVNLITSSDLSRMSSLDQAQRILKDKLKGSRILVVFDDVWNEMSSQWENLCKPLQSASKGSKVIVTTRSQNVTSMNRATEIVHLDDHMSSSCSQNVTSMNRTKRFLFSDEHFLQCAFHDANPSDFPQLESIGQELVKKLAGSPLAAQTVGNLLKFNLDEKHWETVNGRELWQTEQKEDDIMPALGLSYERLPDHLKQCIIYFALFPKNYQLRGDVLIRMWRAHGFINKETPDETAYSYINDLLQISCIRKVANLEDHYVVHDLLHDFAESISNGELFRIEDDSIIPTNVRHLYVNASNISDFNYSLEETLKELGSLRVLVLRHPDDVLPNNIQHMVHLRYLDIKERSKFTHLPTSLFGIYHLQALSLQSLYAENRTLKWHQQVDPVKILGCYTRNNLRHKIDWQAHIPPGIQPWQCKEKKKDSIIIEQIQSSMHMRALAFYWTTGSLQKN